MKKKLIPGARTGSQVWLAASSMVSRCFPEDEFQRRDPREERNSKESDAAGLEELRTRCVGQLDDFGSIHSKVVPITALIIQASLE